MCLYQQYRYYFLLLCCHVYFYECGTPVRRNNYDNVVTVKDFNTLNYDDKDGVKGNQGLYKSDIGMDQSVEKMQYQLIDDRALIKNTTDKSDPDFFDYAWTVLGHITLVAAGFFIVFGGVIPFVFQFIEIRKRNSAKGFSLYVCLTQLIAHTLRIMFWFGKHFELQLLAQAFVMLTAMWILIHTAVNTTRQHITYPYKGVTVWTGHLISHFWAWTDFGSYFFVYTLFLCIVSTVTAALLVFPLYVESIGFAALLIEANLGSPQAIRNWQRKSTEGMSVKMVLAWLCGDVGKTAYFFVRSSPPQFWLCGIIQICIDIVIMGQVIWYGNKRSATI